MKNKSILITVSVVASFAAALSLAISGAQNQDKYTLQVPGGLAFTEFKGYENWEVISASQRGEIIAVIVGNPVIINAFKSGIPGNGKPFPDGSRMAKIHWNAKVANVPGGSLMPVSQHDVDLMVKDSKRFPDGHGWGYATFVIDPPGSNTFRPGNASDKPPQEHDAKCGVECHDAAQSQDYVFTHYMPK